MIIRYTKAEKSALQNIDDTYRSQINNVLKSMNESNIEDIRTEIRKLDKERKAEVISKVEELEDIRFSKISSSPKKVLENAKLQTKSILDKLLSLVATYKPQSEEEIQRALEETLDNPESDEELLNTIEPLPIGFYDLIFDLRDTRGDVTRLSKKQISDFIKRDLRRHYARLEPTGRESLDAFIEDAVSEALKGKPEQILEVPTAYFRIYHDAFIDALPQMSKYGLQENNSTAANALYITVGKTRIDIGNPQNLPVSLGIPTHKLLATALERITATPSQNTVMIPTKEYFQSAGYKISNPATLEKYINRTGEYLKTLHMMVVSETKGRGKKRQISHLSIIRNSHIDSEYITITFDSTYVDFLKQRKVQMQYPRLLLSLDGKSQNSYRIGFKMASHSSNFNNIIRKSNNILKVNSLLNVTDLPEIERVKEQRGSWTRKIRDPFEKSLDKLIESGIISKWYYSKNKGKRMTPQEREKARSRYDLWENSYIFFTMKDAPDQTEAIQKNRDRKKAAAEKRKAREEAEKQA